MLEEEECFRTTILFLFKILRDDGTSRRHSGPLNCFRRTWDFCLNINTSTRPDNNLPPAATLSAFKFPMFSVQFAGSNFHAKGIHNKLRCRKRSNFCFLTSRRASENDTCSLWGRFPRLVQLVVVRRGFIYVAFISPMFLDAF
jgi:hypothetical protein